MSQAPPPSSPPPAPPSPHLPPETNSDQEERSTGLPLFGTWPAVYAFVLIVFVLVVALLTWFTRAYS